MIIVKRKISTIISNIIYIFILIPLVVVTIRISYQKIFFKDRIPDIFGWKIFMVFDENMADEIEEGDLVFTKNVNTEVLKEGDVIAFRNNVNTVTIHEILKVDEETTKGNKRYFKLKAQLNETADTKYISEEKVEGMLKYRIPKLGSVAYFIQKPPVTIGISCAILIVGGIWVLIAKKLDKKEQMKLEQEELKEKTKEDKQKDKTKNSVSV